jgi:hypothetical protein
VQQEDAFRGEQAVELTDLAVASVERLAALQRSGSDERIC